LHQAFRDGQADAAARARHYGRPTFEAAQICVSFYEGVTHGVSYGY